MIKLSLKDNTVYIVLLSFTSLFQRWLEDESFQGFLGRNLFLGRGNPFAPVLCSAHHALLHHFYTKTSMFISFLNKKKPAVSRK